MFLFQNEWSLLKPFVFYYHYNRSEILVSLSLPIFIDIIVIILRELYYYSRQRQFDSQINEENECSKLVRFKDADFKDKETVQILEKTKWGNIQIGDIILLQKDDYCPADILILDMWDQKCTVKTSFIDDQSEDSIKYAPLLTTISKGSSIKGNLFEYRRVLSGRIDIKKTDDIYNFRGYVSLKKDPINEKFSDVNLIQKYSQIKFTDWLVGVVVLCGNDSYSFRSSAFYKKESQRRRPSYFKRKWDIQSVIQILMVCFFSVIVIILRISMSCFKSLPFKGQMIPIAIDFVFTFPFYCSVVNALCFILYTVTSNYLFKADNNKLKKAQSYGINYLNTFAEMSLNSHVIFNSLKIQNHKPKNITTICLKDRYFRMRDNSENQSNSNFKSTHTIVKGKSNLFPPKIDFEEISYMNSPIQNQTQKAITNRQNYTNGNGITTLEGALNGARKKSVTTNWNQTTSSNIEDSPKHSINNTTLPSSGYNAPLSAFKKQSMKDKFALQRIVELDSKSVLPPLGEDSIREKETEHDSNNKIITKNNNQESKSSVSHNSMPKEKINSLIEFEEATNFQTFAENNDFDYNTVTCKVDAHVTKKNVSITQLNHQDLNNLSSDQQRQHSQNRIINEDNDYTYMNISQRPLIKDMDAIYQKQHSISQNNSPSQSQRKFTKMASLQTSQTPHSTSKNLLDHDSDLLTFMKGSFAPQIFHQNLYQTLKGRSSSLNDNSLISRNSQIKENMQKSPMLVSFDNISLYDKDFLKKQEQRSPQKNNQYYQPNANNGSGNVTFFGQSPRWYPQSGTNHGPPGLGTNGSLLSINQKTQQQNQNQNDIFQVNTEQSQQVHLQLTESGHSVQIEGRDHMHKQTSFDDLTIFNIYNQANNHHISPNSFKTTQTGQVLKKSLVDDYQEYEIKSDDDDEEDYNQNHHLNSDDNERSSDNPSGNNLICNMLSSPHNTDINLKSNENNSQHINYLTINSEQAVLHTPKRVQTKSEKNSNSEQEDLGLKNKITSGNIDNLNLITSEIECSNTQTNFLHSNVERVLNTLQNMGQTQILDSQCEYQDNDQSSNNNFLSDQKYERVKRKKSFTNREKTQQNKKELSETNLNEIQQMSEYQEEGTPQNNLYFSDAQHYSKIAALRGVQINPLIQRVKQNNNVKEEDINSADSLQKRLSVSSMLPSTHNILSKQSESFRNLSQLKRSNNNGNMPYFENQNGFTKTLQDKSQPTKDLLLAMSICHETKSKGDRQKVGLNINHFSFDEDSQYILDFTKNHNYQFECSCSIQDQNCYIIKTEEGKEKIQVILRYSFLSNKKLIIVVQQRYDYVMYIRESYNSLPDYLISSVSTEKKQKLEQLLGKMKKQGEKIVFYSKISLSEEQMLNLLNQIRLEISQEKIESLYEQFINSRQEEPSEIQLLGFIGLQEDNDYSVKEMVKELRQFGQKIWVLTSDSCQNTLESCYNYKILQEQGMDVLDFSSSNFDELFYKTRNHLQTLKKALQNELKVQNKDNMGISQSVVDPTLKETSSTPQMINGPSTPITPMNLNNQKLQIERKSTNPEQGGYRKTISKMPSHQFIQKRTTNFTGIPDDSNTPIVANATNNSQNNSNENRELNYYIILSGDSLNIIRNNTYLWDHFCLIAFFASGVVGYEITDEQKQILGHTITTRFHRSSQRVTNIISSLNDIESQSYEQVSVYIGGQSDQHSGNKNRIISQHPDLITNDPLSFLNLFIRESMLQSEVIEETIYLAIHRSYLSSLVIIIWNIWTCAVNYPLFRPYTMIFFHGFQYIATFAYYMIRKRQKFSKDQEHDKLNSKHYYKYFYEIRNQYGQQQIPIMNLKVLLSTTVDVALIYLFYTSLYKFKNGTEMDIDSLANLVSWGVYLVSFCRVFDIHFIKFDRYLLMYIVTYVVLIVLETLIISDGQASSALMDSTFSNGYILNTALFLCFYVVKCIMETILVSAAPTQIAGLSKYINKYRQQRKASIRQKEMPLEIKSAQTSNKTSKKYLENDNVDRSPEIVPTNKEELISPNQTTNKVIELNKDNNITLQQFKSEMTSNNSLTVPILSSSILNVKKINPAQIIRSIFKDKEMDIILSSMLMQEDINLTQTQMQRFTLKFQIKEIEKIFLKGWELLIPNSNRIFYILHFIVYDIGYDVLVLSKVTNEFSSADGGYITSYAITTSTIFILTALTLSKYYQRKNIFYFSIIIIIMRSIKLILLSTFKDIILYPTELIMNIAVASSCLRFSHYFVLLQGVLLFVFLILLTETQVKTMNLETFLTAIGYIDSKGDSDSIIIVRLCFYTAYFIILSIFIAEKYNMLLTIRTNYLSEHNLFKATMKVKDILSILLPKFIREKIETMKQGQYKVAEKQDEVVIVFCDICNFDDIIFNEKTNTVKILDKLYRQFDLACQQNGLQKIETVGKTYLAAAGISDVEKLLKAEGRLQDVTPAKRALQFAFDLQRIVKSKYLYLSSNKKIILKVGIHLGPAISGVIGYHKPQFSLIGDTVNTTSRVCSTGLQDHIIISKEVYEKVCQHNSVYKFQQRDVEAKGKGIMVTYHVFDKRHLRQNVPKKQTLNFLDDTTLTNNQNTLPSISTNMSSIPQLGSGIHNFLSSHNQIHQLSSGLETSLTSEQQSNQLKKNNSNKFIPLKSIPESPSNANSSSNIRIKDFKIVMDRGEETNTSTVSPMREFSPKKKQSFSAVQRLKQTTFGKAADEAQIAKPISPTTTTIATAATPARRRMLKKSSSMTIVDLKPRFKNDSLTGFILKKESREDNLEEVSSPLAPSRNEYIRQIEKDLLQRIELEPIQIQLKELTLQKEKISMHIAHQDHGGGERSLGSSRDENGSSQSSHLRLGICSTSGKGTAEQKSLHIEFLKSITKQQAQSITLWLTLIWVYYVLKLIIVIYYVSDKNFTELPANNELNMTIFTICLIIIFFSLSVSFKRLQHRLSWSGLRIVLYFAYFISLTFVGLHGGELDKFLDSICTYNLTKIQQTPSSNTVTIDSVTKVVYPSSIIYMLEIFIVFMFFTTFKSLYFMEKVAAMITQIIFAFVYFVYREEIDSTIFFFLALVSVIHLRIQYHHMQSEVRNFNNMKTLESKKEELDSLLKNLLPAHILEKFLDSMKKEIPLVSEELDDVTLLFADIAGFTKYSSTTDPIVVVNMLRKLFTDFDDHCLNQNVYKLYTIGDCYVCFGLTNKNQRNPAQEAHNVVRFAFDMINIIDNVRQYTDCNLQMRIGIHTGKVYGGIVGTEIVRYDVYGQDVIIANKMESNGESGHVMVSEATKKLLEDSFPNEFVFDFKESVHIKQVNKDIDGFLIKFNENASVYLEDSPQNQQEEEQN